MILPVNAYRGVMIVATHEGTRGRLLRGRGVCWEILTAFWPAGALHKN